MSEFARTELMRALSKPNTRASSDLADLYARVKELEARLLRSEGRRAWPAEAELESVPETETP